MQAYQPTLEEVTKLFEADAHLGHRRNRLHPKAKKYVYKMEQGTSIIDLSLTAAQIDAAKKALTQAADDEKTLLVVATKKIAAPIVSELCEAAGITYIATKWMPGLLTNFETVIKNVKKMNEMKKAKEEGEWSELVKHERIRQERHLNRLLRLYRGIANLTRRPDVMFIVDTRREKNAVLEARASKVTIIAITDTNSNPEDVDFPIVANDDSSKSVDMLIKQVLGAYKPSGKVSAKKAAEKMVDEAAEAPAEVVAENATEEKKEVKAKAAAKKVAGKKEVAEKPTEKKPAAKKAAAKKTDK